MNTIILGGSIQSALWHMAGYGLANILDDAGARDIRLWWADGEIPHMQLSTTSSIDIGEIVQAHAARASQPNHWLQARLANGPRSGNAIFSPRITKTDKPAEWENYGRQRQAALDQVETWLDRTEIIGLGEPAHWRHTNKDNEPDSGASRWEMKTRNKGAEFIRDRLAPLGKIVMSKSPEHVIAALEGRVVEDLHGKQKPESRTATGLAVLGPVDDAVAWCALWGLSNFPVVHRAQGLSQTPGAYPRNRVHPGQMALPIFVRPTTPARWRTVTVSGALDRYAIANTRHENPELSDLQRLNSLGVTAVARFTTWVAISAGPGARERRILEGDVDILDVTS